MTFEHTAPTAPVGSRWAVLGFCLWASAVVLFVVGVVLGIALYDVLPSHMGVNESITFPIAAGFIAIPVSTIGLGCAITSLVKREPRRGLAITTIVLWLLTPIVAIIVARTIAQISS
jgi:hypothetical protein